MNTTSNNHDQVRTAVRARYGAIATGAGSCCSPAVDGCCSPDATTPATDDLSLGCGNPLAIAALQPGQVVLDLGSGAGFDVFLAARAVGLSGRVIGVDMTPEMLARARQQRQREGHANVEFRLGEIEHLPVADASVDVVISNCVINLSPEKAQVFAEAFRVLRPGGRLAIADIVALRPVPPELQQDFELLTGCVTGAATVGELRRMLHAAGFTDISLRTKDGSRELVESWFPGRGVEDLAAAAAIEARKPDAR